MIRPARYWRLLLVALAAACGSELAPWHEEHGHRWRALDVPRRGDVGFTLISESRTGISFTNTLVEADLLQNQHLLNGSGVALGDVDGDGWVDVYFTRLTGPNALYRNLGNWRFEDITDRAGVAAADRYSTGTVLADVDGDGDLDLLVMALGGPNALFVNDGTGTFSERSDAGLASTYGSHSLTLADIDADGDLDLYVTNYKFKSVKDLFPPDQRAFDRVVQQDGDTYSVVPSFREHYRVERQGDRLARIEIGEPDVLYLNDGTGRFQATSFVDGRFRDSNGQALTHVPRDWGLTARFYDVDDDGDADLYVTNDFESPDRFWLNDGSGHFQLIDRLALRTMSQSAMAVDFSDLDRDGDLDFFIADMLSRDPRRRRTQVALAPADVPTVGVFDDRPQRQRNTLFMNRGDGTYAEVAPFAGVAASGWSWGSMFLDVDLDGYEDLLIATGYQYDALDGDTQRAHAMRLGPNPNWQRDILDFPTLALPNAAFHNRGNFTFDDATDAWNFGTEPDIAHGMGAADLDGDGDLDIVMNRQDAPAALYRNDATAARLAIRLRGNSPNTQGIGAKIRVRGGPVGEQVKEVTSGGMYLSGSEPLYTFAAGSNETLTVTIDWPSGHRSTVRAAVNRLYEMFEPDGSPSTPGAESPAATAPMFRQVPGALAQAHVEGTYPEFKRQPLLPNALTRLGPGVTWYDVDRDGDDDLLVTTGSGGRLQFYRNDGNRFTPVPIATPPAPLDQTTVLPFRTARGLSLLVGQMNYEATSPSAASEAASVIRLDAPTAAYRADTVRPVATTAVEGDASSTGPLALADYDGDGDLDLFVGGRVLPAKYPLAASSRLFANEGGALVPDATANQTFRALGLVSAASFSDIDGDGDPDLVVAVEWGSIRVFLNDGGRFRDATASLGLDGYVGRWNGVATGDFNGDGRMDIVATNWGRNTLMDVSAANPWRLYFGDFDNSGTFDIVEAQPGASSSMIPLADLDRLMRAMPFLQRRIADYGEYADATVQSLLGSAVTNASSLEASTLDHMLFINRGDRFDAVPLPWEAQLAPAFAAVVADYDGDGNEDIFLAQNFFAVRPGADRHDAGRGLWLRGDGTGSFTPIPGHISGVTVYGDQRGAAVSDYDGDGRIDLAVSQNGARTLLFHNERATPGLRVRLVGSETNPDAIGAMVRIGYAGGRGPARELQAGAGYWSSNGLVQVFGTPRNPTVVWVRWPGGDVTETTIETGMRDVTIGRDGALLRTP